MQPQKLADTQTLNSTSDNQQKIGSWLPGHPYEKEKGNGGIEWLPTGQVRLWHKGEIVANATHTTRSEWEFWYELAFLEAFPEVDYWWFGSFWTGKVKLFYADELLVDTNLIKGAIQYVDDETEPGQWTLFSGDAKTLTPAQIFTDLPPFENALANLPLRLRLAELVIELIQGDIAANEWQLVTSLVTPDELVNELLPSPDYNTLPAWQLTPAELKDSITELFKIQTVPIQEKLVRRRHLRDDFCLALGLSLNKA